MNKQIIIYLSLVTVFLGCNGRKEEAARLHQKMDSLQSELAINQRAAETLQRVGVLIDSIDVSRKALNTMMLEGTSFGDYSARMVAINNYVKDAQGRIESLEKRLRTLKGSNSSYTGLIKKLKGDLEKRNQELIALQEQVTKYRNENENLVHTVSLQEAEITDKLAQLKVKSEEITKLEKDVQDLMVKSKIDEAESYFERARAVEETAKRTHFAPRKKRNSRKEALELYKLAALFGKEEAQAKIAMLEKKL